VGASNKAIARSLGLSAATVKANVKTIFRKLHIGNRTEAAAWAVRSGFDKMAAVSMDEGGPDPTGRDPAGRDAWLSSTLARRAPAPQDGSEAQAVLRGSARAA
jgi:hypothetical protein